MASRPTDYEVVQRLIYKQVHIHQKTYGGDIDELISEANAVYMKAVASYRESQAKFSTWLVNMVRFNLYDKFVRRRLQAHKRHPQISIEDVENPQSLSTKESDFKMVDFLDGLSVDARACVRIIFSHSMDIQFNLACQNRRGIVTKTQIKLAISELLTDYGWTQTEIHNTFTEIQNAL